MSGYYNEGACSEVCTSEVQAAEEFATEVSSDKEAGFQAGVIQGYIRGHADARKELGRDPLEFGDPTPQAPGK